MHQWLKNPRPSSAVTLCAVTITSSTDSAEFKTKDSLDVSPTTKLVVTSSERRPAADTLIVYGPPGLNPPAKYLPDSNQLFLLQLCW